MKRHAQLELTHPEHISTVVARVFAPFVDRARAEGDALRREGKHKLADELLSNRIELLECMQRASAHAEPERRRRR